MAAAAGGRGGGPLPVGSGGRRDQSLMSLARPLQTNLEDTIRWEASLPGCEMLCKWEKCLFCAGNCRRVSDSVQKYSVQYKGYNLIRVTTVEGGTTRSKTALVYYSIHSSLYTGTVHCVQGCKGTWPTGLTVNQGRRLVSRVSALFQKLPRS